jgi:hypothetical protein
LPAATRSSTGSSLEVITNPNASLRRAEEPQRWCSVGIRATSAPQAAEVFGSVPRFAHRVEPSLSAPDCMDNYPPFSRWSAAGRCCNANPARVLAHPDRLGQNGAGAARARGRPSRCERATPELAGQAPVRPSRGSMDEVRVIWGRLAWPPATPWRRESRTPLATESPPRIVVQTRARRRSGRPVGVRVAER